MILVIARPNDLEVREFCAAQSGRDVAVLTPRHLSHPGLLYHPTEPDGGVLPIGAERVPVRSISGVLVRMTAVESDDLPHVVSEDRSYVAAEMTAFLRAFLAGFPRPVLNRPHGGSLCGPWLFPEQWLALAHRHGVEDLTVAADATRLGCEPTRSVTVVGTEVLEAPNEQCAKIASLLARHVGCEFLTVSFLTQQDAPVLVGASPLPSLHPSAVRDALCTALGGRPQ